MKDLSAYKKPALQFSGGKDSLACLYLLRDQLEHMTVYWCDTGDACPETVDIIEEVREWIPNFEVIHGDVKKWREFYGMPSDLVPANSHPIGMLYQMSDCMISNRFDCCAANLMRPMHDRMMADGVDLVIRGTKLADTGHVPIEGKTDCYDVWLPIRDWSHADVFAYLEKVGAPYNALYRYFKGISAPECLGCTAWWDDGKAAYLRERHPLQYVKYQDSLKRISRAINQHLGELSEEIEQEG